MCLKLIMMTSYCPGSDLPLAFDMLWPPGDITCHARGRNSERF